MPVVANMLAIGAGLIFGLFLPTTVRADDPPTPPATVPTPTVPTPDPAPPKRTPKPTPSPRQVSRTPTYSPPVARTPSTAPVAHVKPEAGAPTKSKPKRTRHGKAVAKKRTTPLPKVTFAPPIAAVSVRHTFQTKSGDSFELRSLLILLGLAFAITCFTIAIVPATYVKWRPAAIFVSDRQLDVTVVGLALLAAAACTLLWANGP
jgi:hypothetical protein